ncbi:phosphotransferase [Tundrisphaera lichenicola]|uniref:phosphotransferase n=1 Tax=Tundrisphaera lichenicola TaxID=2029860 RepID=UPI003EBD8531
MTDTSGRDEKGRIRDLLLRVPALSGREFSIEPLGGGMTNRNFLVEADGESYVARVAGEGTELLGIDRDREAACARAAFKAGVGPEVVGSLRGPAVLVTRFVPGRVLTTESLREPTTLRRVAQSLRRCHEHPAPPEAAAFSPFAGARLNHALAKERQAAMPGEMGQALATLDRIERDLPAGDPHCLCHNDMLPANLIEDDRQIWIIDWEFAGLGDRYFDLAALAANGEFDDEQEEALLAEYLGEVRPQDLRRLRLMRLVSNFRESTWGYLQSVLSNLYEPDYYQDYGKRYLELFLAGSEGLV